jgi:predicted transposase YbfD/YdcC
VAVRIMDQKEGTQRCEQTAARALIDGLASLDGQTVTADPLHCQRELGRGIVEKGGEYLFQIKGNQPNLLKHARRLCQEPAPLLSKPNSATAASNSAD